MTAPTAVLKTFVMISGERYCLLVDPESGVPLFYPNLFVTTQVRNAGLSVSSMQTALVAINVLYSYCTAQRLDIETRLESGEYLAEHELDGLRDFCQRSFKRSSEPNKNNVFSIRSGIRVGRAHGVSVVKPAVAYTRLSLIADYLSWLSKILVRGALNKDRSAMVERMCSGLRGRRPLTRGRSTLNAEISLTKDQLSDLQDLVRPDSPRNPFHDGGVRSRNNLIIQLLIGLGVRGGELLNIRVSDIDWTLSHVVVARRPDDKNDPRVDQPLVKTQDRRIPINGALLATLRDYVVNVRKKIPGAKRHEYLLVVHKPGPTLGAPLSKQGYFKMIDRVADSSELNGRLHGHLLRHTWNHNFSEYLDSLEDPPTEAVQEKMRSYIQGWKEGSGTASVYNARFIRKKAAEASLSLQNQMMRLPKGVNK